MLRMSYKATADFWEISEKLAIEMEPELSAIDKVLDDEELIKLIKKEFSHRYPKTLETGRKSSPVEVLLRMLTVKRLYSFTYRETEWHVRDSLVLRWFCRVYWAVNVNKSETGKGVKIDSKRYERVAVELPNGRQPVQGMTSGRPAVQ
ncbi:transposase [Chloroflexi bacterium TSY]|nr:transposase [Chloroflexi bacterium TSY]